MKPIKTKGTNTRLILPHEEELPEDQRKGDLPVERCVFDTEGIEEQRPGFESTWMPDEGERKALANGAPVILRLWGEQHPPVNMHVGEPAEDLMQRLVTIGQTRKAASLFFDALSRRLEGDEKIEPGEIPVMFEKGLLEVMRQPSPPPSSQSNGNGS